MSAAGWLAGCEKKVGRCSVVPTRCRIVTDGRTDRTTKAYTPRHAVETLFLLAVNDAVNRQPTVTSLWRHSVTVAVWWRVATGGDDVTGDHMTRPRWASACDSLPWRGFRAKMMDIDVFLRLRTCGDSSSGTGDNGVARGRLVYGPSSKVENYSDWSFYFVFFVYAILPYIVLYCLRSE